MQFICHSINNKIKTYSQLIKEDIIWQMVYLIIISNKGYIQQIPHLIQNVINCDNFDSISWKTETQTQIWVVTRLTRFWVKYSNISQISYKWNINTNKYKKKTYFGKHFNNFNNKWVIKIFCIQFITDWTQFKS